MICFEWNRWIQAAPTADRGVETKELGRATTTNNQHANKSHANNPQPHTPNIETRVDWNPHIRAPPPELQRVFAKASPRRVERRSAEATQGSTQTR